MSQRFSSLLAISLIAFPVAASAQEKPLTRSDVEAIVKQYIMDHPEVLIESVNQMQQKMQLDRMKKAAEAITTRKDEIMNDPDSPVAGNPSGDVTVVEFFDYNCGYCKRMVPIISKVMEEDKNIRFVFKEFPILSATSATAAKAALAVYRMDKEKYFPFHSALMKATGSMNEEAIMKIAESLDIDTDDLKEEMKKPEIEQEIDKNHKLAEALNVSGTPAFIIGEQFLPGAIDEATLREAVKEARAKKE